MALRQESLVLLVIGKVVDQLFAQTDGGPEGGQRPLPFVDSVAAEAARGRGGGSLRPEGRVVPAPPQEVGVVALGGREQLLAQRLLAGGVERPALADGGEVLVHRGAAWR